MWENSVPLVNSSHANQLKTVVPRSIWSCLTQSHFKMGNAADAFPKHSWIGKANMNVLYLIIHHIHIKEIGIYVNETSVLCLFSLIQSDLQEIQWPAIKAAGYAGVSHKSIKLCGHEGTTTNPSNVSCVGPFLPNLMPQMVCHTEPS